SSRRRHTSFSRDWSSDVCSSDLDLFLTLYDGVVHEVRESEPESFQRLFYDRQRIRLEGVGNRLEEGLRGSYRSDREMSIGMLRRSEERRVGKGWRDGRSCWLRRR